MNVQPNTHKRELQRKLKALDVSVCGFHSQTEESPVFVTEKGEVIKRETNLLFTENALNPGAGQETKP